MEAYNIEEFFLKGVQISYTSYGIRFGNALLANAEMNNHNISFNNNHCSLGIFILLKKFDILEKNECHGISQLSQFS